jgi:DNA-binding transcriptional MocR family regulator
LALNGECDLGPWARLAIAALTEEMGGAQCYVSVPTLAARMAVSERTVHAAIAELEREGFLVVERRAGVTSLYRRSLPPQTVRGSRRRTTAATTAPTTAGRADDTDTQIHRYPPKPPQRGGEEETNDEDHLLRPRRRRRSRRITPEEIDAIAARMEWPEDEA